MKWKLLKIGTQLAKFSDLVIFQQQISLARRLKLGSKVHFVYTNIRAKFQFISFNRSIDPFMNLCIFDLEVLNLENLFSSLF